MSTPQPDGLNQRALEAAVNREVAQVRDDYRPADTRSTRCRICNDPDTRRRVNTMLSHGMRPAEIAENLADINAKRRNNQQINYWSVWNHRKTHFDVQETEKVAYLRMLEKRYAEEGELLADGVGNILTAKGFLEIMASKGMIDLIEKDKIPYAIGVEAQLKLEQLVKADRDVAERAALRRDVALIQQAIIETLDETQMRAVSHRLDVLRGIVSEDEHDDIIEGEIVDDDDVADFTEEIDDDDELDR